MLFLFCVRFIWKTNGIFFVFQSYSRVDQKIRSNSFQNGNKIQQHTFDWFTYFLRSRMCMHALWNVNIYETVCWICHFSKFLAFSFSLFSCSFCLNTFYWDRKHLTPNMSESVYLLSGHLYIVSDLYFFFFPFNLLYWKLIVRWKNGKTIMIIMKFNRMNFLFLSLVHMCQCAFIYPKLMYSVRSTSN